MRVCIRRPRAGGHIYLAPAPPSKIMASKVGNGVRKLSLEDADREKFLDHTASDFNILVTGRFCVGKSEPINATFFQNSERKAKVVSGDFKPCTRVVNSYSFNVDDIKFNVYDTPGLQDAVGASNDDRSYITMIEKACCKYS